MEQRPATTEVYPRCDRPGTEWGESWVTARYAEGKLVELKRYERFSDDARAVERWNELVGARTRLGPESAEATAELRTRELEPGTRSVKVFRVDAETIVGVYLMTPTSPRRDASEGSSNEGASILEAVVRSPRR
ncbi:MAG: hypothetical protein M3680_32395 [Myxococcota bacterium]|nr:hypothetical protein [Myxococcota bacterium]